MTHFENLLIFSGGNLSEDCLLIIKNTSQEITKTLELKNVMLLVMKNIWSSVKPVCKNLFQDRKITFKQILKALE